MIAICEVCAQGFFPAARACSPACAKRLAEIDWAVERLRRREEKAAKAAEPKVDRWAGAKAIRSAKVETRRRVREQLAAGREAVHATGYVRSRPGP